MIYSATNYCFGVHMAIVDNTQYCIFGAASAKGGGGGGAWQAQFTDALR